MSDKRSDDGKHSVPQKPEPQKYDKRHQDKRERPASTDSTGRKRDKSNSRRLAPPPTTFRKSQRYLQGRWLHRAWRNLDVQTRGWR